MHDRMQFDVFFNQSYVKQNNPLFEDVLDQVQNEVEKIAWDMLGWRKGTCIKNTEDMVTTPTCSGPDAILSLT